MFCLDLDCESTQLIQRSKGEYLMKPSFQSILSVVENSDAQRRLRVSSVRESERRNETEHHHKIHWNYSFEENHPTNDRAANEIGRLRTLDRFGFVLMCAESAVRVFGREAYIAYAIFKKYRTNPKLNCKLLLLLPLKTSCYFAFFRCGRRLFILSWISSFFHSIS